MRICFLFSAFFLFQTVVAQTNDTITTTDLSRAANIFGISFTPAERDSMLREVVDNRTAYARMRMLPLDNSVPPSIWQQALLPGMATPAPQQKVKWNITSKLALPANKNELAFYSVLQLASLIKHKKISSVELTRYFIDRIKKYGDTLECVITVTEDIALQQAAQADAEIAAGNYRGPLHGIPYGLKDLFAVKGTRTTWGAAPYKEQMIDEDAHVYTKLKDAGAVLVAKFTLGALAMGDWWYGGRTRNPWNLNYGSSGSSAGSAAATAAGLVPFAIGTETYGSIISPSHTCGATGLRPTFGSIGRGGAMTLSWSLDKVGPICRNAEDAAVVFYYLKGKDAADPASVDMPFNYTGKAEWQNLRIGYAKNYFDRIRDTTANEYKVLNALKAMGVQLIPLSFPDSSIYSFDMMGVVIGSESAAAFDAFTRSGLDDQMTRQNRSDWPNSFRAWRFIPAVEYINANRHRYLMMRAMDQFFKQVDVVITPTFLGNQMAITNLTGHPALCFPTGVGRSNLPTSITLLGKLFDEATLLAVGKAIQEATGWHNKHPERFR